MSKQLFEVGDRLVCIKTDSFVGLGPPPLKEDKVYIAKAFLVCKCGCIYVDVGIPSDGDYVICGCCYERHKTPIWYARQERFVSAEHAEEVNAFIMEEVCHV